jgi:hypothetical protein
MLSLDYLWLLKIQNYKSETVLTSSVKFSSSLASDDRLVLTR